MKKILYPVGIVFVLYLIFCKIFIFLCSVIGIEITLSVSMTYSYVSLGLSMLAAVVYCKKKFKCTFSLEKINISTYWIVVMILCIILGIGFHLFDCWPYMISSIAKEAARLNHGTQEQIEAIKASPFLLMYIGIIGPVLEEFFFRGILYNQCEAKFGVKGACILSAFFWAIFHVWWVTYLYVFPMGLILAYFYYRTKNVMVPIVIHGVNNFYGLLIEYKVVKRLPEMLCRRCLADSELMKLSVIIGCIMLLIGTTLLYFVVQLKSKN